jgi:hypothetical protein
MKTEIDASTLKSLRVAGKLLLLNLAVPILNWVFIMSGFITTEGNLPEMITANEPLFQLNIFIQVFSSILILALGSVLYRILKDVNPTLSVFALLLKAMESGAILVLALLQFLGLIMINAGGGDTLIFPAMIVNNYVKLTSIAGVFMGTSMLVWMCLFLKSGFIPKAMGVSGIIAFALVALYDTVMIIYINSSPPLIVQLMGTVPMLLFQVGLIVLLLIKKY